MTLAAQIAIAVVAVIHAAIMFIEMVLWTKPYGLRAFGNTPEKARDSAVLAANQGLYNGFLAGGLAWSLANPQNARSIAVFFLGCVMLAGVYGAMTAKRSILFVQFLPAATAMALVLMS
jgi:putative membrane protein